VYVALWRVTVLYLSRSFCFKSITQKKEKLMMIQKLRLQRGWSQQQLAEISGLSSRTISRIERGETPSLESLKALAAVFNVDFNTLKEQEMDATLPLIEQSQNTREEAEAFKYVRKLRGFYSHLTIYILVISGLCLVNLLTKPQKIWFIYPLLGWGIGLFIHASQVFTRLSPFGVEWEKRQVEKYLGRKL
jgi:transcriptional regulator with XRE-family HTH domain